MDAKISIPPLSSSHPPWLDLPVPLSEKILERLALADYVRFAAVCPRWRSIQGDHRLRHAPRLPPMLPLPWLISRPGNDSLCCYSPFEEKFYSFRIPNPTGINKYIIASSHGWAVLVGFSSSSWLFSLLNPASSVEIQLPPLENTPFLGLPVSLSMTSPPDDPNCVIFIIRSFNVFLWRAGDSYWTKLACPRITATASIFFRGKFYCTWDGGKLCVIDPLPTPTVQLLDMNWSSKLSPALAREFTILVESDGDMLLVCGGMLEGAVTIQVFMADLSGKMWVRAECLGNRMLLLGQNCSISLLAADAGGRENFIYFPYDLLGCLSDRSLAKNFIIWQGFDLKTGRMNYGPLPPTRACEHDCSEFKKLRMLWTVPTL